MGKRINYSFNRGSINKTWFAFRIEDGVWLNDFDRERGFLSIGDASHAAKKAARICCGGRSVEYLEEQAGNGSLWTCDGCGKTLHVFTYTRRGRAWKA